VTYSLGNPCPLCGRAEPKHNHSTERCGLCPAHGCARCKLTYPPIVLPPTHNVIVTGPRGIEADRLDYPHTHRTRRGGVFPVDWETSEPIPSAPD
jgi:hypothetical protein